LNVQLFKGIYLPMEEFMSAKELGDLLGLGLPVIRKYKRQGVITKAKHGQYNVRESVRSYCGYLREQSTGRLGRNKNIDLASSAARLKDTQRQQIEMRMAIAARKLVEVETILPTWKRAMREIRQTLLAVPGRCRARAPHWSNFDQTIVDDELPGV
jgi:phage terminase Nu1 subunit (DNA packaging protein)